jgi:hypothetical protein
VTDQLFLAALEAEGREIDIDCLCDEPDLEKIAKRFGVSSGDLAALMQEREQQAQQQARCESAEAGDNIITLQAKQKSPIEAVEGREILVLPLPLDQAMLARYADEADIREWAQEQEFLDTLTAQDRYRDACDGLEWLAANMRAGRLPK